MNKFQNVSLKSGYQTDDEFKIGEPNETIFDVSSLIKHTLLTATQPVSPQVHAVAC